MTRTLCETTDTAVGRTAGRAAAEGEEEVVMLLQLERDEEATVEAVTVLLQLKKELPPHAAAEQMAQ